jgi:nitroreductase
MKTTTLIKTEVEVSNNGLGSMTFSEMLLKRRSIRKYLDKPVDLDLLKDIIQESTLAPSAGNEQPWKFIIVQNPQVLQNISEPVRKPF